MRLPRIRDWDGTVTAGLCSRCGEEIYEGEGFYRVEGQDVCIDCLADFAKSYFAPCRLQAGEDRP